MAESERPEYFTLFQFFTSLKHDQAWTALVIFFSFLAGAFVLGYKLNSYFKISEYRNKPRSALTSTKQFRALQTKERFLSLYLRYLIAKGAHAKEGSKQSQQTMVGAASDLKSYINDLLKRGEEVKDEIELRGLFLGKGTTRNGVVSRGQGSEPTVKFGYDGSTWPLPIEFASGTAAK